LLPPFVGVAVNVIVVPEQTLLVETFIDTAGTTLTFTDIVIELLIVFIKQPLLLVIVQLTASLFERVFVENEDELPF